MIHKRRGGCLQVRRDVFISYASADTQWAKWIAGVLEHNGFSVFVGAWDLRPGDDFVIKANEAIREADVFMPILSDAYTNSVYCKAEFSAALNEKISKELKLIPVRVTDTAPTGLLASIIYIDLYGSIDETEAERRLLNALDKREIARKSPQYPGEARSDETEYPGGLPINNLPPRNRYFTGRNQNLDKIPMVFKDNNFIQVTGLGGIGKTQLALEYAYRYGERYTSIIWFVSAVNETTIFSSFVALCKKVGVDLPNDYSEPDVQKSAKEWLEHSDGWLLILDDLELYETVMPYLPLKSSGHILITTRVTNANLGAVVNIGELSEDEAVEFLKLNLATVETDAQLKELAKKLGYFPLALEQAASYILETKVTIPEYFYQFDSAKIVLTDDKEKAFTQFDQVMLATLQTSFSKISESAKQLLYLCAYMAPHEIPHSLFIRNIDLLPEPLRSNLNDKSGRFTLSDELEAYALITGQRQEFSVHPYYQWYLRQLQEDRSEWVNICLRLFISDIPREFDDWESKERFVHIAEHAYFVAGHAHSIKFKSNATSELYFCLGYGFDKIGQYDKSLDCYHKALMIHEKTLGKKNPDTAKTYNNIANVYKKQGDYSKALEWLEKASSISEKVIGKENPSTAKTYNNIASVYKSQGDYASALEYYHKALAIFEKVLGREHPDTATTYNNIAGVYYIQGDYPKALELYQKNLAIDEKILGREHPDTATTHNNIAFVYSNQGDYGKALEWYYKALEIREKVLGENHPDTATTYNNIAFIYSSQGNYLQALEWFYKSLEICEKVLGREHPDTAITYNNIALVYSDQGDYQKALEWFHKALAIDEKILGKEHPSTVRIYNNISAVENLRNKNSIETTIDKTDIPPQFIDLPVDLSKNLPDAEISEFCEWYVSLESNNKLGTDLEFRMFLNELRASIKKIKEHSEFSIDDDNAPELCQYTKLNTLKFLVKASIEDDKIPNPKFRLSNVAYLNDPSEGQIFIDLLNHHATTPIFDDIFGISSEKSGQPLAEAHLNDVYIGSFSTAKKQASNVDFIRG
jgi:tetratricopeptide (TPR) repeat protein